MTRSTALTDPQSIQKWKFLPLFCNSPSVGSVEALPFPHPQSIFSVVEARSQPSVLWSSGNEQVEKAGPPCFRLQTRSGTWSSCHLP